eukprot:GHVU01090499.1.p2 GENE.GHVU01090499.1~~GHVU01090499.1.p2  ORF type:complete len:133 (-),score=19.52 GHVU01090499.1:228-626(-)
MDEDMDEAVESGDSSSGVASTSGSMGADVGVVRAREVAVEVAPGLGDRAPPTDVDGEAAFGAMATRFLDIERRGAEAAAAALTGDSSDEAETAAPAVREGPQWYMGYRAVGRIRCPSSGRYMLESLHEDPDA